MVLMVCVGSAVSRGNVPFVKGITGEINRLGCGRAVSRGTPRNQIDVVEPFEVDFRTWPK